MNLAFLTRLPVWLPPTGQRATPQDSARSGSVLDLVIVSLRTSLPRLVWLGLPGVVVSSRFATKEVNSLSAKPIVLKVLLQQRYLQTHRAFCREYDKVAAVVDPTLRGGWPSKAQFYRWLSGDLVGLPYTDHCRILEGMFPDWKVDQLFHAHDEGIDFIPESTAPQTQKGPRPAPSTRSADQGVEQVVAFYPHRADTPKSLWMNLLVSAQENIDLFANASLFLPEENPETIEIINKGPYLNKVLYMADSRASVPPGS
jgi:hypothetical protein